MLHYGKQSIDEDDINAVVEVLRSDWLTTGPKVVEFERAFASYVGAEHAVAVSSGTAALHAAMFALNIGPGDEVIVPPITFAATANCVVFQGGTPVFADVDAETLLIDPECVRQKITNKTKAVIAVDYAGQPCQYNELQDITARHNLALVSDACHSLGATFRGKSVGTLADLTAFSFHPVKPMTTGEGGMITTSSAESAERMRSFRNHGITTDHWARKEQGSWHYEMVDLGYNYRLTDFQSALGLSQLQKLPDWIARRQEIAAQYDAAFVNFDGVKPLSASLNASHAYHLYVIRVVANRRRVFEALRDAGIGVNVHYIPVHFHPFYRENFNTAPGLCPVAERAYEDIISLPIFPGMSSEEVATVVEVVTRIVESERITTSGK